MIDSEEIIQRLNRHSWVPKKEKTGILLIDLQEYFRDLIIPILDNLKRTIAAAHKAAIPLIFTKHGHDSTAEPGMLGKWWPDLIIKGSEESLFLPELEVREDDTIIPKATYSAFYGTKLEAKLIELGIEDVVIGGVMTNLCCETTARDAFVRDFRVFFLADGTSTTSEDFHLATLKNISYGFATLISCKGLMDIVKKW